MAEAEYEDAHLLACANAITALGNRIGLYQSNGNRVGTVYADTTWQTATKVTEGGIVYARRAGSTVTILVPSGTLSNGAVIYRYGILNGSTLLRKIELPVTQTVNNGSLDFQIDVTPVYYYRSAES
jgi:hypothetical protein